MGKPCLPDTSCFWFPVCGTTISVYHSVWFSYSSAAERLTLRDRELYGLPENDAGLGLQDWHKEVDARRFGPVNIE